VDLHRLQEPLRADPQARPDVSEHPAVQTRTAHGVVVVEMARPERRNALDEQLQAELRRALEAAADDPAVRGVILTGQGRAFSAGGDLARLAQEQDPTRFRRNSQRLTELITLPERIEKPVIAAINGVLTGAGAQLALACDLRIAARSARFLFREGHLGLVPAHGGCARMVRLIGLARARDVVLGGADLPAEEALRLGLVTAVVADEVLLEEAQARLAGILERGAQAYGLAKRLLNLATDVDLHSGILAEGLAQSILIQTDEHHQRVRAALAGRRPDHPSEEG
jgi:enoyl-CoA hydratase/carnithine racemase